MQPRVRLRNPAIVSAVTYAAHGTLIVSPLGRSTGPPAFDGTHTRWDNRSPGACKHCKKLKVRVFASLRPRTALWPCGSPPQWQRACAAADVRVRSED